MEYCATARKITGGRAIITQAERVRNFFKKHPKAKCDEVEEATGVPKTTIRVYVSKDLKSGRCVRDKDGGLNYSSYFQDSDEKAELREWQNDVRRELIDQLLEANRHETASDQIRLNAKEINKLLNEVTK